MNEQTISKIVKSVELIVNNNPYASSTYPYADWTFKKSQGSSDVPSKHSVHRFFVQDSQNAQLLIDALTQLGMKYFDVPMLNDKNIQYILIYYKD